MFEWVVSVIEGWGYPGVFLLMLAENLFPPIPSEVIMPLAGFLVGQGKLNLGLTILAGTAGSVIGTSLDIFPFCYCLVDFCAIKCFQLFISSAGCLLSISQSITQNCYCSTRSRDSEPALFILVLFFAMIHIVFAGNLYIFACDRNILPREYG